MGGPRKKEKSLAGLRNTTKLSVEIHPPLPLLHYENTPLQVEIMHLKPYLSKSM